MSLKAVAEETLSITDAGSYVVNDERVDIGEAQRNAVAGTRLFTPPELERLLGGGAPTPRRDRAPIAVTREKTHEAARRIVHLEGVRDLVLLNFASARNVGGGFLTGARAQEEDVARASGLYRCLETQPRYYEANRNQSSFLYTDHLIYSPRVPFFRDARGEVLEAPFVASVITAPAPNAGEHLRREKSGQEEIQSALLRRVAYVLAVAEANGHSALLLGAWGCGVFRNDPAVVADAFLTTLDGPRFRASFARVDFAVFDTTPSAATFQAFEARGGKR